MYIRLKNQYDLESLKPIFMEQNQIILYEKIKEDLLILDNAYGVSRSVSAYGGYIILCIDPDDYTNDIQIFCKIYQFDCEAYEYLDNVWNDSNTNIMWKKILFLLGSDDSLLIYYPTRLCKVG